jgi:CelD/BcsL family acetyltransferase involved in cellulose biosynthesis
MSTAVALAPALPYPVSSAALGVEAVTSYDAFVQLEAEWNDAVDRAGIPHPFLRHEWVRTWWDAFGAGATLHILVVRANGRISAIAPLMHDTTTMYGIPARRIRFIQNDHTPRTDFIIAADADDSYRAIWNTLRRDASWDVLQLSQIERSARTHAQVRALATADGCRVGIWSSGDSPFLTLAGSWDDYFATLPAKFRSNLRNRLSRLVKIGEPTLEILTDRDAILAAQDDAWRLESSGWKQESGTAITSDPAVHRFYASLIERGTAGGWLHLLFLRVGDRRIATSYGATFNGRLMLFKTGYDPEFATCSPFKLLTYFALQDACARGLVELDFLGDAEPWKLEWTSTTRGHDWVFVFAKSIRAQLLHLIKFQWGPGLKRWRA